MIGWGRGDDAEHVASRGFTTVAFDVSPTGIAGAAWLARHFGPAVADPVRLHVAAKRYLCAVEPAYLTGLSPASRRSLWLQGGPFTPREAASFEREPHWRDAVALRRWDDGAKVAGLAVRPLESYRPLLNSLVVKP